MLMVIALPILTAMVLFALTCAMLPIIMKGLVPAYRLPFALLFLAAAAFGEVGAYYHFDQRAGTPFAISLILTGALFALGYAGSAHRRR